AASRFAILFLRDREGTVGSSRTRPRVFESDGDDGTGSRWRNAFEQDLAHASAFRWFGRETRVRRRRECTAGGAVAPHTHTGREPALAFRPQGMAGGDYVECKRR